MSPGRLLGWSRVCPVRRGGGKQWAALCCLSLAAASSGCAGTPLGERLSGSFPPPREPLSDGQIPSASPASPAAPAPGPLPDPAAKPPGAKATAAALPPGIGNALPGAVVSRAKPTQPAATPQPPAIKAPPSPATNLPFPYRVTLRLPRADPSAPAEAVTQALRAAGIPFEVETIERVTSGAATPQAQDGSTTPPSVRPAPPPR